MSSKSNKITENEAKEIVKRCFTIADFCREVGWEPRGSNYKTFHKYEKEYNLDTSHFDQSHGRRILEGGKHQRKTAEEYASGKCIRSATLLRKMVEDGVKEWRCECCGETEWLGDKIPLELHHIDGDHFNNSFDNIELLCPNCHAKTENYRGKNGKWGKKELKCRVCGKTITRWSRNHLCKECYNNMQRRTDRPTKDELQKLLQENSFVKVGEMFGVSDNAIRKWCKFYDMPDKSKFYKK